MNRSFPRTTQVACATPAPRPRWHSQTGLTMVELLVALVLSSFIAIAAVSSLVVARRGFSTLDAASQLRDNGRFATELIQRVVAQAGYLDVYDAVNARSGAAAVTGVVAPPPYTFGANNALFGNGTAAPELGATYSAGVNGSDILAIRYQTPASAPGGTTGDNTTINCAGLSNTTASAKLEDLTVSVFHVMNINGEPTLMCSSQGTTGTWVATAQPLMQGVESFQVLYGVDGVTPNTTTPSTSTPDYVADRYLRADQIAVSGNADETAKNWRRVRSVRIGMLLRGPANSAQDAGGGVVYFPLGENLTATGTTDVGARFTAPADGRLRQAINFTVYLRNDQAL
ncbi:MAG: prepilin-type cleavage/methylation domain-containing protein [Haliea sp.]|nr:MAG: prepilin-type cleavage/methylation domain-containing protein [Haliea sp.]